jgi:2-keto-3-deoxy-6-phosphogluconate aldolase
MTDTSAFTADWPPKLPLVAILRGLQPERAVAIARVLFDAGFRAIEVPLNRPGALDAIAAVVPLAPADAWVGAGTVLEPSQVDAVADTGAGLIVSPHFDPAVVRRARERGLRSVPGIFTASEAFAAWRAGADALKIFPAEAMTHEGLKGLTTGQHRPGQRRRVAPRRCDRLRPRRRPVQARVRRRRDRREGACLRGRVGGRRRVTIARISSLGQARA